MDEFNLLNVPDDIKKEGNDWFAIFNPNTRRVFDVNLAHSLMHER